MHKYFLKYLRNLNRYQVSVALLILATLFIRFYNFPIRWGISSDNARDGIVALEALSRHQLLFVGPFSSAGPFITGCIYYWLVMASYLIFPFLANAPWVMTGIISVISVILLIYLGKILVGKRFSIVIGILAMLSSQYVGDALVLSNPTFVTVFSILTIIFFLKFWQKNSIIFVFLMGLSIGLAISMHYAAINLMIFLPAILFIPKLPLKYKVMSILLACLGALVPSLPLLYWDAHQGFANTRNILDYFLIGQYRIYVPNSWKLFLLNYFPFYWGRVIGGNFVWSGLILFVASGLAYVLAIFRKKVSIQMLSLGLIFLILLFINKSYRGERSDNYMLYFSPFILIFTAFAVEQFFNFKNVLIRLLGVTFLGFLILINLLTVKNALTSKNIVASEDTIIKTLKQSYPNQKFSLYDYKYETTRYSMPLSFLLRSTNSLSEKGVKIGVNCRATDCIDHVNLILNNPVPIVNLSSISPEKLDQRKGLWVSVSASTVYDNQVGWLNKNQLKSTFSLKGYIMSKLGKI
jgi:hypothetical protein